MESTKKPLLALLSILVVSAAVIYGCGGSDQPEYCDKVSTLQDSVSQLTDIQIDAGALDKVKSDLETIQTDAEAAVDAAKDDFPSEANDLEDSIDKASSAIQDLPSSPSATEIGAVAFDVSAVVNSAKSFQDATSSACD